ncbi:hypothetical protein HDV01_005720 [Terramyces sp. JEL0728]|nr:hypothetical protein HDV01_005720 [Terramyces sp. JEL0728]
MRVTAWTIYKDLNVDKITNENPNMARLDVNRLLSSNFKKLSTVEKRQLLIDYQNVKTEPASNDTESPGIPINPLCVSLPVPTALPPFPLQPIPYLPVNGMHPLLQGYQHYLQMYQHQPIQYPLEYNAPIVVDYQVHNPRHPTINLQSTDILVKVDASMFKQRSQSFNEQHLKKVDGCEVINPNQLGIEYVDSRMQDSCQPLVFENINTPHANPLPLPVYASPQPVIASTVDTASPTQLNPTTNSSANIPKPRKRRTRKPKVKINQKKDQEPVLKTEPPGIPITKKRKTLVKFTNENGVPVTESKFEKKDVGSVNDALQNPNVEIESSRFIDTATNETNQAEESIKHLLARPQVPDLQAITNLPPITTEEVVQPSTELVPESNELLQVTVPQISDAQAVQQPPASPSINITSPKKVFDKSPSALFDQFLDQTLFDSVVPN